MSRQAKTNAEGRFHDERHLSGAIALREMPVRHAAWFLAILLLLLAGEESWAAPRKLGRDTLQGRRLVVELCDHTGLSTLGLRGVRYQVDEIYRSAGINIVWRPCIPDRHSKDYLTYEAKIYIRDRLSDRFEVKNLNLAFDGKTADGYPGPVIYISRSSVEEFVGRSRSNSTLTLARALGRVLAHELAHRFLQTALHTEHGILRPRFSRKELTELRPCRFYFTEEQVFFLHSYVPNAEHLHTLSVPVDDDSGER